MSSATRQNQINKVSGRQSIKWPVNAIRAVTFVVPLLVLAIVAYQPWFDPKMVFLDPLVAAEIANECCSVSFGFMSQLGIMVWISTAAICLFSGIVLMLVGSERRIFQFALTAGFLTGWLAIDDAFMLHEKVLPALGISQNVVLFSYIVLAVLYVATSWRLILENDFVLLMVGGTGFAVSIAIDIILHTPIWIHLEDSAKFFGICCWASFHITTLARIQLDPPA